MHDAISQADNLAPLNLGTLGPKFSGRRLGECAERLQLFLYNPVDDARSVNCPTLILHGEKDERTTLDQARAIAAAMGQNARFVSFAGVPHMSIVDARPVEWTLELRAFLHGLFRQ